MDRILLLVGVLAMVRTRPALAFRWLSADAAGDLCSSSADAIAATWRHRLPSNGGQQVAGVCLSRNPRYLQDGQHVRLAVDLGRIRQACRVVAVSADYVFDLGRIRAGHRADPDQRYDRAAWMDQWTPADPMGLHRADEEFVIGGIGGIRQASRCIVGIDCFEGIDASLAEAVSGYAAGNGIPVHVADAPEAVARLGRR